MKQGISIIIAAHNEEGHLGPCLESLRNQSYSDVELIVVDNNSIDRSAWIARAYTDIVLFCPTRGISSARNIRAFHASGDIFIDTDGVVSRGRVEKPCRFLGTNGDRYPLMIKHLPRSDSFKNHRFYDILYYIIRLYSLSSLPEIISADRFFHATGRRIAIKTTNHAS